MKEECNCSRFIMLLNKNNLYTPQLPTWFVLCFLCRYHQFICCSESSPEEASLSSSVEPPRFNRWEMNDRVQTPTQGNMILFVRVSDPACLFTPSGIVGGKLCRDSLGNAEMLKPLAVSRNRKSPRQIAATGWVWSCGCRFACCSLKFMCLLMCFSVRARGIKRTWEDKIWRYYGINI